MVFAAVLGEMSHLDRFIPAPRLREVDHVDLGVPLERAHLVCRHLDLGRSAIARALFSLRTLPNRLHGEVPEHLSLRIDDITRSSQGFRILVDEPDCLTVGAIGKVWESEIPYVAVTPENYESFDEPGWVKVAWEMRFERLGAHTTRVTIEVRVSATDDESWRSFRRYFRAIGPFSRFIRQHLLELVLRDLGDPQALETERSLPGDLRIPNASAQITQGITIAAAPRAIWPWLVQMGCGRGGWYSYDWLDNGGKPSARRVVPEFQDLAVGDELAATPEGPEGFVVDMLEPGRALVLYGLFDLKAGHRVLPGQPRPEHFWEVSWAFALEPLDAQTTRLIVRARAAYGPKRQVLRAKQLGAIHFFMEKRQLENLKHRAEGRIAEQVDTAKDVVAGVIGALRMVLDLGTPFLRGARSHWGLTVEEADRPHPGDDLVPEPRWSWTHAIEIDAPPESVWPWVVQMGQDKAGFYSYQWLENAVGCEIQNADALHAEWQDLRVGDALRLAPQAPPLKVVAIQPGRYFVALAAREQNADVLAVPEDAWDVRASWLFMVEPIDGARRSRFTSRYRVTYDDALATRLMYGPWLAESIGFVMDRQMLLGTKRRVEEHLRRTATHPPAH